MRKIEIYASVMVKEINLNLTGNKVKVFPAAGYGRRG